MKTSYKILIFTFLCFFSIFLGIETKNKFIKNDNWGDEFYGKTKSEILEEFGKPSFEKILSKNEVLKSELTGFYPNLFEDCNINKVEILTFNKLLTKYEFWILDKGNKNNVILVK